MISMLAVEFGILIATCDCYGAYNNLVIVPCSGFRGALNP